MTVDTLVQLRRPSPEDGRHLWDIAWRSGTLDLNSSYAYNMWCRDFRDTSIVAVAGTRVVGFVTGYLRPESPSTLFVWQVAVEPEFRGIGIGVHMLDQLLANLSGRAVSMLETTVTRANLGSVAMFASLARKNDLTMSKRALFNADDFPDPHEAEDLYIIGPIHGLDPA